MQVCARSRLDSKYRHMETHPAHELHGAAGETWMLLSKINKRFFKIGTAILSDMCVLDLVMHVPLCVLCDKALSAPQVIRELVTRKTLAITVILFNVALEAICDASCTGGRL